MHPYCLTPMPLVTSKMIDRNIIVSVFWLSPPTLHPIVEQMALDEVESPKPNFAYYIHFSAIGLSEPDEVKLLKAYCWVPDKMRER